MEELKIRLEEVIERMIEAETSQEVAYWIRKKEKLEKLIKEAE